MRILVVTDPAFLDHDTGHGHPERPARLEAVLAGAAFAGIEGAVLQAGARAATSQELELVHPPPYQEALQRFCEAGGGFLDGDTHAAPASWPAALLAAGAGLGAVEQLEAGEADAAFCAVRPPGHHATPRRAMGFCLLNNVAVTAATLAERGERVVVVDIDAHHGNGTQDAFWEDPRVMYVSFHEYPLYPGTGSLHETGVGSGLGTTLNLPLPAGATGDVYRAGIAEVVAPMVEWFSPTWVLISAGFDAHRRDPLTGLHLSAGDVHDITVDLLSLAPPGRVVAFLEGGYDLQALADSTASFLAAVAGVHHHPEAPTSGGPGLDIVAAARRLALEGPLLAG